MSVSGSTEVVARRRGEAELGVNEIFDDRAVVVADRAVRLVASDQWKIHRREVREKTVVRREALDRSDHDLRLLPVRAFLFVLESAGFRSGFGLSGEASALDTLEIEALAEE